MTLAVFPLSLKYHYTDGSRISLGVWLEEVL
jgi:hypothetical protein